jgi:hypothetical protein
LVNKRLIMKRFIFITIFLFAASGYQRLSDSTWSTSESEPTLWIKFCDKMQSQSFSDSDLPDSDVLRGQSLAFNDIIQSVIDDFNNVTASYLRLAIYPTDPNNPGTPETGDTTFTIAKGEIRTIEVCIESSSNPFQGGHALPKIEDGKLIGCEIVMSKSVNNEIDNFISTLTHEIGHCVGFDHAQDTIHSIMSYHHKSDEIRLMIDDKIGLVHMFPRGGYDLKESPNFGLSCSFKD